MNSLPRAEFPAEAQQINRRSFLYSATVSALALGAVPAHGLTNHLGFGAVTHATAPDVRIAVLPRIAGSIGERFCGLSYEKNQIAVSMFTGDNRNLIGLFRLLGPGVLRIGGNQVDRTTWDRAGVGRSSGRVAPSDVDGVAEFARLTGWKVLYGVNLAQSTPVLAADEVAYATRVFGSSLSGIEIGNEPDGFVAAKYFPSTWKYADYIALWRTFAHAILQRSPSTVLTGPATAGDINWFRAFAADASKEVRLLTHHFYRGDGHLPTSDVKFLVSYPDNWLMKLLPQVRAAAEAANLPFRFSETNSFYGGGSPNVSNSYASALWVIDDLFSLAAGGCSGANFHSGGNSTGYTPIADIGGNVVGPRPEYYGIYLFTQAGQGELRACQCDSAGSKLTAYAVTTGSGALNMIVVSKEPQTLSVTIDLAGISSNRSLHSASITMMTNTLLTATSGTTIGGRVINLDGSFSPRASETLSVVHDHLHCSLPPISAALIKVS